MKTERRQFSRKQREAEAQRRFEMKRAKKGKEERTLIQKNTARQSKRKAAAGFCMLAAMIFLMVGCGTGSVFDGSRVSDAFSFRMEYSMLNREESADLNLMEGDRLQVDLSHTEGSADVTVGMEGKEAIYRGNKQQNADFVLEITETGSYHISVYGQQAKGSVSFSRISEGQE